MKKWVTVAALIAFSALPGLAQTTAWKVDPNHTAAQFSVKHLGVSTVRGAFMKTTGEVQLDEKDITKSQIDVTVDTTSVDTRNETRDKDVKSPNFLDVATYPTMTFKSKRITSAGDGKLKLTGDLTLHGVTKEVTFDVDGPSPAIKDPWGNLRRGASATATINRQDFGINYNKMIDTGGLVVSNDVQITIDIEFIRKP
ncbi:MAG TPA: YceI family protein [Patescibacteria group bacterium]|nr:YceI family protein [Patescibacteria group bacterium]